MKCTSRDAQPRHQLVQHREVALEAAVRARRSAGATAGCSASCRPRRTGSRSRSACSGSSGPRTARWSTRRRTGAPRGRSGGPSRCEKSGTTGSTPVAGKPERLEFLPVELRVAERQVAAVGVRRQLAPAVVAEPHEQAVNVDEVLGRRDVVVDEHHPVRQRVRDARRLRPDGEVVDQDVVAVADASTSSR